MRFPGALCLDLSSFHLKVTKSFKITHTGHSLFKTKLCDTSINWYKTITPHFSQPRRRLRWSYCEVSSPQAQRAVVWSCGWLRVNLCWRRCWKWCCLTWPEERGVYPQGLRYHTLLKGCCDPHGANPGSRSQQVRMQKVVNGKVEDSPHISMRHWWVQVVPRQINSYKPRKQRTFLFKCNKAWWKLISVFM